MPITYRIDPAADRVLIRFTGIVTDHDLFQTFDALYRDPLHRVGMAELTDCREVERVEVTSRGLQSLAAATRARLDTAARPWKVAIVAPLDVVFGLARMYELLREGSPEEVQVFRDLPSAERWLEVP